MHTQKHTYMHTFIHTYIHTYIHTPCMLCARAQVYNQFSICHRVLRIFRSPHTCIRELSVDIKRSFRR